MTDIYDFRDEVFKTYKKEWTIIFNAIWNYVEVKQKVRPVNDFIFRASQISHHELIYLPSKNSFT